LIHYFRKVDHAAYKHWKQDQCKTFPMCISWNKPAVRQFMKVILSSYITYEDVFSLMPLFQWAEILLKASDYYGARRSITWSFPSKKSAVSKSALVSRGQTTRVLLHPSVRIVNIHTVFELGTSTSKRHTEFQHCICAAIQLSSHSLGWCTQAHIPLLLRKRMRETACVCCGETVSPEWGGTAIKVFQSQWKRRAGRVWHYSVMRIKPLNRMALKKQRRTW